MYCVLFGKKPASYYKIYRDWFRNAHNSDVEIQNLPFIPPSHKNFIYDPFSINFECPFDKIDYEELVGKKVRKSENLDEDFTFGNSNDGSQDDSFNFENFMKCIKDLSYSSMFSDSNSKKFHFKPLAS